MSAALTDVERTTLATYEASAADWSADRDTPGFWAEQERSFLRMLPLGTPKVLDVGSGAGRDAKELDAAGCAVTGIDISSSLLGLARQACPTGEFVQASVYNIPYADLHFDGLWAVASLLHLPKRRLPAALGEMRRVLKYRGPVFVAVKAGEGEGMDDGQLGRRYYSYYGQSELRDALHRAGFEVEVDYVHRAAGTDWVCSFSRRR